MRLGKPSATSRTGKFQNTHSFSSPNKACSTKRGHRAHNIRFGLIATYPLVAKPTCPTRLKSKSNDSRRDFAIAFSPGTNWPLRIWKDRIRTWPAATSTAERQIFGNSLLGPLSARLRIGCRCAAFTYVHHRLHLVVAFMECAAITPRALHCGTLLENDCP